MRQPVSFTLGLLLLGGAGSLLNAAPVTGWEMIFNGNTNPATAFTPGTAATGSPSLFDADRTSIAANFPTVVLSDGDSITLTGTVTLDKALVGGQLRIGLLSGATVADEVGNPYVGLYTIAPAGSNGALVYGPGTHADHPFGGGTTLLPSFISPAASLGAGNPIDFVLSITRDGDNLDITSSYIVGDGSSYSGSGSVDNLDILATNPSYDFTYNTAGFLHGGTFASDMTATYSNIEVSTDPGNDPGSIFGERLFGIDFNRDDQFGSPSQSMCRTISGSAASQAANQGSYTKTIASWQVALTRPDAQRFEFRGANTDSSRAIPGGDVSRSFMVSDFIGTRGGRIDITLTGLAADDYVFRSFHLEPFTGAELGFAQGTTTTSPNTIEARIGAVTQATIQPTALGATGLNTTFIDDSQVPTLVFPFTHDGSGPLTIELHALDSNGPDSFLFLNGFELFTKAAQ